MSVLDKIYAKAKENLQRVAFPEATNEKMMQAAYETGKEGYIIPVLVGDAAQLKALAQEKGYDLSVFTFVDTEDEEYKQKIDIPVLGEVGGGIAAAAVKAADLYNVDKEAKIVIGEHAAVYSGRDVIILAQVDLTGSILDVRGIVAVPVTFSALNVMK